MPAKNIIKIYLEKGFYHIYNRGVEGREIFRDQHDYQVFLNCFKLYLLPKEEVLKEIDCLEISLEEKINRQFLISRLRNFSGRIDLLAFVLMPNHFHLLLRQHGKLEIQSFMRCLLTKYVAYFNKKYQRVGPLFQSRYKAVLIEKEEYFLHVSRYIHLNPLSILPKGKTLADYPWSSYPYYLKNYQAKWLNKSLILSYFKQVKGYGFSSYQGFVEGYEDTEKEKEIYQKILMDF